MDLLENTESDIVHSDAECGSEVSRLCSLPLFTYYYKKHISLCVLHYHLALEQFKSKNRQYGNAVCPECKQSFVNAARLERHLAVHQVFGAYLCPLCGKTYKYEYNLFFHWRKTCQYLNELIEVFHLLRSLPDLSVDSAASCGFCLRKYWLIEFVFFRMKQSWNIRAWEFPRPQGSHQPL
uniref:C2H2-type domain-containing protein n=1 Tax=Angiostrongylus cantonensis TaxID=6313 RepID=A0A0K0DIZ2_ANGCA